jgi:hypothetical protein
VKATALAVLLALPLAGGCGFMQARGDDFLDCWRGEVFVTPAPGVWVMAGPLAHLGAGMNGMPTHDKPVRIAAGWTYGMSPEQIVEHFEWYLIAWHGTSSGHACFGVLPILSTAIARMSGGTTKLKGWGRTAAHLFDIEFGLALPGGGTIAGFSPGEFLDFLLGWFGIDLCGDDGVQGRDARRLGAENPVAVPRK